MTPKIAIPSPTSADAGYNDCCWPQYAFAVRAAGGEAVRLSLDDLSALGKLIESCDGLLLPGSPADVDPVLYGQQRHPSAAASDAFREGCDRMLLDWASSATVPVLGICFGLQLLNVWSGRTLVQDLRPVPVNHAAGPQVAVAHGTLVAGRSLLGGLLAAMEAPANGQFRRLLVNSSHHQAIAIVGEGLTVVARSVEDGVVEAVEGFLGAAPVVGVQWHPERSYQQSPSSKALFSWLVMEAMDRAERSRELVDAHPL